MEKDEAGYAQNNKEQYSPKQSERTEDFPRRKPTAFGNEQPEAENPHDEENKGNKLHIGSAASYTDKEL